MSDQKIPYGYCHCGCGEKTKLHTKTYLARGHIAGTHRDFINGHQNRGSLNGQYKGENWKENITLQSGSCECGCGGKTELITRNRPYLGLIKGTYQRFIKGHARKGKNPNAPSLKYPTVYMPHHSRANAGGRIQEHIIIAEKALGGPLPLGAQVHHYTPEQLVICQDQGYHSLLHQRQRALEACGHASWLKCPYCGEYDNSDNMYVRTDKNQGRHRECTKKYSAEWETLGRRGARIWTE